MTQVAYKLLNKRKDGSLGPLFINRKQRVAVGEWLVAQDIPTKGYKHRPGWHCCLKPSAPHLSDKGRVWCRVLVDGFQYLDRPESQGGTWVLAQQMKVLGEM